MHLTLLLPELLWPEPDDALALGDLPCPALERLLHLGRLEQQPRQALETCLAAQLGTGGHTLAASRLAGEVGNTDASAATPDSATTPRYLAADPVHLQFHHERIIVGDSTLLDLQADESAALMASLNQHFSDLGHFSAPAPQRWYLAAHNSLPSWPDLPPPSAASGRQLGSLLPDSPVLARLMNELQMLLHTHPVNEARAARRQPLVNGLWLWGSQICPAPPALPHAVWADNPLARGLARLQGIPGAPAPASYGAWQAATRAQPAQAASATSARQLVLLEALLPASLLEDAESWRQALIRLEHDWFAPLLQALGQGCSSLNILSPGSYGLLHWHIKPPRAWQGWRFWHKPARLQALSHALAAHNVSNNPTRPAP